MPSPCELDDLTYYTNEKALQVVRYRLQRTEKDQNTLDGGGSYYTFTSEDAKDYIKGMGGAVDSRDITPLFRNRERK